MAPALHLEVPFLFCLFQLNAWLLGYLQAMPPKYKVKK